MGVRLRLARFGTRKFPFYRIYAADARSPRDGKHPLLSRMDQHR